MVVWWLIGAFRCALGWQSGGYCGERQEVPGGCERSARADDGERRCKRKLLSACIFFLRLAGGLGFLFTPLAIIPPSTTSRWPVDKLRATEARNTAATASSASLP